MNLLRSSLCFKAEHFESFLYRLKLRIIRYTVQVLLRFKFWESGVPMCEGKTNYTFLIINIIALKMQYFEAVRIIRPIYLRSTI